MIDEKVALIAVFVVANLANLDKDEFWTVLDNRAWCHAYNAKGQRRELSDIPKSLKALTDDPYRSLAGELIRAGGCAKNNVPFSEFLWADFLRRRIKPSSVAADFGGALVQALDLARGQEAKSLPGWSGADPASWSADPLIFALPGRANAGQHYKEYRLLAAPVRVVPLVIVVSIECAEDRGPARRACSAARLPRASECAASGSPARSRSSEATVEP